MKESNSRAAVFAAVDDARLDLEAAAEREHRARLAYEEALAAAVATIGVTAVSREVRCRGRRSTPSSGGWRAGHYGYRRPTTAGDELLGLLGRRAGHRNAARNPLAQVLRLVTAYQRRAARKLPSPRPGG